MDVVGLYATFGVKLRPAGGEWAACRCFAPGHDDRHASAQVNIVTGGFVCFGCNHRGGVLTALDLLGVREYAERRQLALDAGIDLNSRTRDRPPPPRRPVAVPAPSGGPVDYSAPPPPLAAQRAWEYHNGNGDLVGRVIRVDAPDGKRFFQQRPNGNGGWEMGLNGKTLPLYRLVGVRARARARDRVYVVEGEKAVDALHRLGLFATTSPGGAGKWRDEHSDQLGGADVVVFADCDYAGRLHAIAVVRAMLTRGICRLPVELDAERSDGYDVVDELAGRARELRRDGLDPEAVRLKLRELVEGFVWGTPIATDRGLDDYRDAVSYRHDPSGKVLADCLRCGRRRLHDVRLDMAFCPCGAHRSA